MSSGRDPVLEKHYRKSLEFAAARLSELSFEEGLIGRPGPPGPRGNQGMTGVQGVQGVQGLVGPQGLQGNRGLHGFQGEPGRNGFSHLRRLFVLPPVGASEIAHVEDASSFRPRMSIFLETLGWLDVRTVTPSRNEVTLLNAGYGFAPPGTEAPIGALITPCSPPGGPQGPPGADSSVPGPPGPAGESGPQGEPGVAGERGLDGAQGPAGSPGERGDVGPRGERGQAAFSALSNQFEMPNVGAAFIAFVQERTPIPNGSIVTIGTLGYLRYERSGGANQTQMIVWNDLGYPGTAPPGSIAPAGSLVVQAGIRGAQGEAGPPAEIGEWIEVTLDAGWTGSLRGRLVNNGRSVELDGAPAGAIASQAQAQICVLPAALRAAVMKCFSVSINSGLTGSVGHLEVQPDGRVLVRPLAAMTFVDIHVSYPLD